MKIGIHSVATANPPLYVTQKEVFDFYDRNFEMSAEARELYRRVLLEGPIRGRYFGLDHHGEALETDPDRMVERHSRFGVRIAAEAARKALDATDYRPSDLGGLIVNTCTGYLCPGLSSYLVEALALDPSVKVLDIMGMGCGAAIPNLECAAGMTALRQEKPVLSVSVEICSATMFPGDDPGLIVSNSIFGDGASAAIVGASRNGDRDALLHFIDFETKIFPAQRDHLRYRSEGGRLRNVLGRRVPILCAEAASGLIQKLLARNGMLPGDIEWWAVHPGGTSVLKQLGKKLDLSDAALAFSYDTFREYGNMSSPTVMYVLKSILDKGRPEPGSKGILLSFGAGFTAFGALVCF